VVPWPWLAILALLAALAWRRIFDSAGTLTALALGLLVLLILGPVYLLALIVGMVLTFGITVYGRTHKEKNDGPRGVKNVLANNVGVIVALALAYAGASKFTVDAVFFSSLGFAIADTFGSEGGSIQGKAWLITTLKRVNVGTDGGISHLGEIATVLGAGLVLLLALLLRKLGLTLGSLTLGQALRGIFLSSVLAAHIDSLLGATLQRKGLMDNHSVNAVSCLSSVLLAYVLT